MDEHFFIVKVNDQPVNVLHIHSQSGDSENYRYIAKVQDFAAVPFPIYGESLQVIQEKFLQIACRDLGPDVKLEPYRDTRPSWNHYFMEIAKLVATRSTCPRKAVGAVIVMENRLLTTGYNGAVPKELHCTQIGCDLVKLADGSENCVRTVHAEQNALLQAACWGIGIGGGTLYTNTYPCWHCARAIASAGISQVFFADSYRIDERTAETFRRQGIRISQVQSEP